jgi:hypothetical protein
MMNSKTVSMLWGLAMGTAIGAVGIGLLLIGTAIVSALWGGAATSILQHPLYASGSSLVLTGFLSGMPLVALWHFSRKQP